jgi:hypothetical protein
MKPPKAASFPLKLKIKYNENDQCNNDNGTFPVFYNI